MDKTLTRKIGYVKPRTTKEVKSRVPDKPAKKVAKKDLPPKTEKQEIKEFVATKKATVASVRKWLESHPFFKVKPMCQEIGIDDSNFKKALADGAVPSEHIAKVVKVISQYGFKCLLFLLLAGSLKAQDTKVSELDTVRLFKRVGFEVEGTITLVSKHYIDSLYQLIDFRLSNLQKEVNGIWGELSRHDQSLGRHAENTQMLLDLLKLHQQQIERLGEITKLLNKKH